MESAAITYTKGSQSGNVTLDDGVYAFTLAHNESIVFDGIPRDTVYTITETDANAENYVTTYSGARTGTLTEPYELTVTNSRTIAVPTGVNRYYGWLALLGAAAAGAGYTVFKKRRHTTA